MRRRLRHFTEEDRNRLFALMDQDTKDVMLYTMEERIRYWCKEEGISISDLQVHKLVNSRRNTDDEIGIDWENL